MQFTFLLSAVIGGTVFVIQFLLSLLGMGDDMDGSLDVDTDIDFDGHVGDADGVEGHGSTHFFSVISLRTVAAALAFFGLAGLLMMELTTSVGLTLAVAIVSGAAAMYIVHYLMRQLFRLRHDGTSRIEWSVGESATVYVPIPGGKSGRGKVQIRTREGIRECGAVTASSETLATGTVVRVVGIVGPSLVEVAQEETPTSAQSGA